MSEILKEQLIISKSPEAIAYRNIHRPKVDKYFSFKMKAPNSDRKRYYDNKARQLWRKIIRTSNTL